MERTTFEPFQNLLYYRRCVIMLMRMFLLKNENVRSLEKFLNVGRWFDVSNIVTFIKDHFSIRLYSIIFLFSFFEISWFVPSSKSNFFYASRESLIFPPIVLFLFPVLFEIVFTDKLSLSLLKRKKKNDSVENLQDAWKNLISTRRVYDRWSKIWSESRRNEVRPRWKGIRFVSGEPNRSLPPPQSSLRHDTVYAWDFPIFYFVYRFRGRKDCVCYEEERTSSL